MKKLYEITLLIIFSTLIGIVNASIFVYYPINTQISPKAPPIIFKYGSNTGRTDLRGTTITATMGDANTSLTITIHPTYQKTYYKDIARINNTDENHAYYVMLNVINSLTNTKILNAKLYLYEGNVKKLEANLLTTGTTSWVSMNAKAEWRIDIEIEINETGGSYNNPPFTSDSTTLKLIYSTQNIENPP